MLSSVLVGFFPFFLQFAKGIRISLLLLLLGVFFGGEGQCRIHPERDHSLILGARAISILILKMKSEVREFYLMMTHWFSMSMSMLRYMLSVSAYT